MRLAKTFLGKVELFFAEIPQLGDERRCKGVAQRDLRGRLGALFAFIPKTQAKDPNRSEQSHHSLDLIGFRSAQVQPATTQPNRI